MLNTTKTHRFKSIEKRVSQTALGLSKRYSGRTSTQKPTTK